MFNPLSSSLSNLPLENFAQSGVQTERQEQRSQQTQDVHHRPKAAEGASQTYMRAERFSNSESFSLQLVTQEGDTVEINFGSSSQLQQAYGARNTASGSEEYYSLESRSSSEFGFSVKGDLNTDELDAIISLVNDISTLADDFFSGDLQSAWDQAGDLAFDASQLASMDLSLEQSTSYTAVEKYREVQALDQPHPGRGRGVQPFAQQLAESAGRVEAFVQQSSSFSVSLLSELITHDNRFKAADEETQTGIQDSVERLRAMITEQIQEQITQSGDELEVEAETDDDN